ncbi:hypothetical protein TL16_g08718 [Triparma laevis f. inornata]|uniref:EF-hand domain-containing protein n=1 Tax=Triparma laevis f. inornata TaxID=1714386 RepID=A0A9W7B5K5_9STRA|nr:hypothetical protein TL16_g08718 [Triparma laevis f. inornata]
MSTASIDFSSVQNLDLADQDFEQSLKDKKKKMDKFKKQLESKEKLKEKADKRKAEDEKLEAERKEKNAELMERRRLINAGIDPDDGERTDTHAAYVAFGVMDIDGSGRISLRELQRYLAGDAEYFYECSFTMADVGMNFECNKPGIVTVLSVEELSPSQNNPECEAGLKLLSFNGLSTEMAEIYKERPSVKELPETKKCEETLEYLQHLIKKADKAKPYVYKFLEPKYFFNEYNNMIDVDIDKIGLKTVEIRLGAYNSHTDFVLELQTKMRQCHPKLGKAKVDFNRDTLCFTIESGGPEIAFPWKTGPHKNEKAGPIMGFENVDTEFQEDHSGKPMSLDLDMMITADQVKIFTYELMVEIDQGGNSFLEFEEFVQLFNKYLETEKKQKKLVDRVVERFLSAQQKDQRKVQLEEKKKRLKRQKAQLKAREKQKAIAKKQAEKRKGTMKRDADGVLRAHTAQGEADPNYVPPKPRTPPPPREKTAEEIAEEKEREKQKEKKRKQADKAKAKEEAAKKAIEEQKLEAEKTRLWQEKQHKLQLSMLGLESMAEDSVTQEYHPASTGFIMKKMTKEDPELINPIYFGTQNMKLGEGKSGAGVKLGQNYKKYKKKKYAWIETEEQSYAKEIPTAPITSGQVRQKFKEFGEKFDNQEVIHPSMFGQMCVRKEPFDAATLHPVFHGYILYKKPFVKSDEDENKKKKDEKASIEVSLCPICYVGKEGCPRCWDFPEDFTFSDYAYEGPKRAAEEKVVVDSDDEEEEKPEIHTNLTTINSLKLYRAVNQHWVTLYIKTVPCGQIVKMQVEKNWTVGDLYENFRSTSAYGRNRDCFLFLPTESGVFSLDNEDMPETDALNAVTTGRVELSRYNFTKNNAVICLLHFQFFSEMTTAINISGYLTQNLQLEETPNTEISPFVDAIPKDLPGPDKVQAQLTSLMKLTMTEAMKIAEEDAQEDQKGIDVKIKFKVDELRDKLLGERKEKNDRLKAEREARREKERKERNDEFHATYKDILKKEKEDKKRLEEEERRKANSLSGMLDKTKNSFKGGLPGINLNLGSFPRPFSREKKEGEGGREVGGEGGRVSPIFGRNSPVMVSMKSLPKIKVPSLSFGKKRVSAD